MEQRLLYVAGESAEHSAADFRQLPRGIWRTSGVLGPDDLRVVPRGAGAAMRFDLTAGRAHIDGYVARNSATITDPADGRTDIDEAPPSGTERIDSVQARVIDVGDGLGEWRVFVAKGTPATIDTAVAPTIPGLAIELAHVRVPAGTASIQAANIIDRRVPASLLPWWPGDLPAHAPQGTVVARSSNGGRLATRGPGRWVENWPNPDLHERHTGAETLWSTGNNQVVHSVDLDPTRHWKVKASWSGEVRRSSSGDAIVAARLQAVNDVTLAVERQTAGLARYDLGPTAWLNTQIAVTLAPSISLTRIRVLLDVTNNAARMSNSNLIVEAWPA